MTRKKAKRIALALLQRYKRYWAVQMASGETRHFLSMEDAQDFVMGVSPRHLAYRTLIFRVNQNPHGPPII